MEWILLISWDILDPLSGMRGKTSRDKNVIFRVLIMGSTKLHVTWHYEKDYEGIMKKEKLRNNKKKLGKLLDFFKSFELESFEINFWVFKGKFKKRRKEGY
ncbi:MAG TPA: hypothetical protein VNK44_06580 [Candidatus Nitrosotenuis sp.]|nr:hypothetical protein [Candidatus Nitrosotenuis sp.]